VTAFAVVEDLDVVEDLAAELGFGRPGAAVDQYTSLVHGAYAKQSGIDRSMGSIGDPWDNALAETFFASLEKELLRRERFDTREQARMRIFCYIECFYNTRRRHFGLDYLSPNQYEQRHQDEAIAA
jgi:putative transposase